MTAPTVRIVTKDSAGLTAITAAVAGRIPASPPSSWFDRQGVPEDAPLTFEESGRVYGLLAPDTDHIGMPGQHQRPPKSPSGYRWFHRGQVRCDDGSLVATGPVTMGGGHASVSPGVTADAAQAHYDDVGYAVCDVIVWDGPKGTMCAGAARPGLTAEQIRTAMASQPSGDWRQVDSPELDMIGAHLVNTPGFMASRVAFAASGAPCALVASGAPSFRIVLNTPSEENTMTETAKTEETAPEAVTAAAPNPFAKGEPAPKTPKPPAADGGGSELGPDSIVTVAGDVPPGVVTEIDGDVAKVEIEVPVDQLEDAGEKARASMVASAQNKLRDKERDSMRSEIASLREALAEVQPMVASVQAMKAKEEDKEDEALLASILGGSEKAGA